MTNIQKLFSLWNKIVVRDSNEFYRADIVLADELIQALRKDTALHKGPELRAAAKFLSNTLYQQMVAVGKEFQEVHYAYLNMCESWSNPNSQGQVAYKDQLAEELVDLQTACQTLLVMLGVDIDKVRHDVIEKNRARGYYNRE